MKPEVKKIHGIPGAWLDWPGFYGRLWARFTEAHFSTLAPSGTPGIWLP